MNDDSVNYTFIIPYKVIDLVSLITELKKLVFLDAINYLYSSQLYNYLSDETTKLWHLSTHKLFSMLEEEKINNQFEFPDFV